MDTLDVTIGVLGLLIAIGIALIPYFRKVYFVGPELTVELIPDGGSSGNKGLSHKNDTSKGYIEANNAIYVFELTWNIRLRIINNSNITAYYPELSFLDQQLGFTTLEKLDKNIPIKENEQIILKGTYKTYEECEGKNRTHIGGLPDHLKDLKILLEYKNPSKTTFYTIYNNSATKKQNRYSRRKPKDFKRNQ